MNNFLLKTLLGILLFGIISYSQDTAKKKIDTVKYKPLKFILSDYKYSYINQVNPDTVTRRRFLWHPMKNTEDIFNFLPGYYLFNMDVGQLNPVEYNQLNYNTAVLRHGRPINDFFDGSIDFNLLSKNELAEIELNNGFGNILNSYSNAVNLIQRQIFQNRPYTEISFTQDRFENLYFDGDFHQNLFRNLNFNFGITKHSYDGKYVNSDFDKWLGRFNLNFAASNKLNFFAYVNYATIQKGLNGGIIRDTVNFGNKEEVFDPTKAVVVNSDSYEKKERFDIDIGAVFLAGKSSFTKLQFYESNSFREYRDEENRLNSNGFFYKQNAHWINYGIKLQQLFYFKILKKFDIISRSEGEYNQSGWQFGGTYSDTSFFRSKKYDIYRVFTGLTAQYRNATAEAYYKEYTEDNFKTRYYTYGFKGGYTYNFDSLHNINLFLQYTSTRNHITGGFRLKLAETFLSASAYTYNATFPDFFNDDFYAPDRNVNVNGVNLAANLRLFKFDLDVNLSGNLNRGLDYVPRYYGNASLSYHDMAIKNKLEYKIGFNSRAWTGYRAQLYAAGFNSLFIIIVNRVNIAGNIPSNFTLDFFIMGRIGRATFGITLENILNRVIYNTGVYPMIDRGGLANVVSRFNLTWNFFD